MSIDACIALTTFSSQEQAEQLIQYLLEHRWVACASIIPGVKSMYRWEGKIETAQEVMVIFKTKQSLSDDLIEQIKTHHPYEVPEVLIFATQKGLDDYLNWIDASTA